MLACAFLATSLAACAHSDGLPVVDPAAPADMRVTLPPPPPDVEACLRRSFPEVPDRDLTSADVVRLIARAKILDREKRACGLRAVAWIAAVRRDFARP